MSYKDWLAYGLVFLFIIIIFYLSIKRCRDKWFRSSLNTALMYVVISITAVTAYLSGNVPLYHLWIAGCMLIVMLYNAYFGIMAFYMALCIAGMSCSYTPSQFAYYQMLGVVLCFLFEFFPETREKLTAFVSYIYFIIIGMCTTVSMYLVTNGLNSTLLLEHEFAMNLLYTVVIITVIYVVGCIMSPVFISGKKEINNSEDAESGDYLIIREILSGRHELYIRMQEEKPQVLKHSQVVANVSGKAAEAIGADSGLAMAGGLLHEAGKILEGDDYIENNAVLAGQYGLGDRITGILMSHNLKKQAPDSKEAAIVYFTDYIINTIFYFKNIKKDSGFTGRQIIDNIFAKKIDDGNMYECGLTLKEYGILKNFYIEYFGK